MTKVMVEVTTTRRKLLDIKCDRCHKSIPLEDESRISGGKIEHRLGEQSRSGGSIYLIEIDFCTECWVNHMCKALRDIGFEFQAREIDW